VILKTGLGFRQGYWKSHLPTECIWLTIDVPISCCFWAIQCEKISRPRDPGQGSIEVIEGGTIR